MPDTETMTLPPLMVRTEITRPDRRGPSIRLVDWNDRAAVKRFSRAAREALELGGTCTSRAL